MKKLFRFLCTLFFISTVYADVNVLVIGSSQDRHQGAVIGSASALKVYDPSGIRLQLQSILSEAGLGTANVVLEDRASVSGYRSPEGGNLASWFHYPYPAGDETTSRQPPISSSHNALDHLTQKANS